MIHIAVLHGTLPQLLSQSSSARSAGVEVVRSAADMQTFRSGLATQRIDALVLSLSMLGSQPVREIDRLRKYTRARATIVTHNFADGQQLRAVEDRVDLIVVREPVTPTRLRGILARVLDAPEIATDPEPAAATPSPTRSNPVFDELLRRAPAQRRFGDLELNRLFEEAIARDYEFTQYVAELLIHLHGFEDYCRRRNAGRPGSRGLNTDVEHGVAHARALFEESLMRLAAATGLDGTLGAEADRSDGDNVHDIRSHRRDHALRGDGSSGAR